MSRERDRRRAWRILCPQCGSDQIERGHLFAPEDENYIRISYICVNRHAFSMILASHESNEYAGVIVTSEYRPATSATKETR